MLPFFLPTKTTFNILRDTLNILEAPQKFKKKKESLLKSNRVSIRQIVVKVLGKDV